MNSESEKQFSPKFLYVKNSFGFLQYSRFHNVLMEFRWVPKVDLAKSLPNFDSFKVGKLELKVPLALKSKESVEISRI